MLINIVLHCTKIGPPYEQILIRNLKFRSL